jgi:rhamnogalacturonyl hydrolase YesR
MLSNPPAAKQIDVHACFAKLLAYCRANNWSGYDPYDALNSSVFEVFPFVNRRLPRLVLTQALKRSPINIRGLLGVPKTQNAKAIALFLAAFLRLPGELLPDRKTLIQAMVDSLVALRSPGAPYWCWGYSFPWQTRKEVVPAGTPNLVCTVFVANALLDTYDQFGELRYLSMATSAADYILNELYWTDGASIHSFSYPSSSSHVQVHNANFLAAALLCRISSLTGDKKYAPKALAVTRCSVMKQKEDGSWNYGEGQKQRWIDNFHTGFNLGALNAIDQYTQSSEFADSVCRGFEFYRTHFFCEDGAPRYFHNRTYPIDIHCVAQSLITLTEFQHLNPSGMEMAHKVVRWTLNHMWDHRGFFYYRVLRMMTIRTSYMRWSQAWMLLALTAFLQHRQTEKENLQLESTQALAPAFLRVNGND